MNMQTSLQGIARRASREPKHRFQDMSRLLSAENLQWRWSFLKKDAAPGVDKVDYYSYQENLLENIESLVDRLKKGTYKAKLVRREWIPKGRDKLRPLGIPAIEDKLVQIAVKQILEAIYELFWTLMVYDHALWRGDRAFVPGVRTILETFL